MGTALIVYPFLFLALFFESFILVTLLSKPARATRARKPATNDDALPAVAVIVPCWNEGETLVATTESVLALDYPALKLEVVLVDNASTDDTPRIMERYRENPRVRLVHESKQGKHHAVNAGIAATSAEFIGCLDADSFVAPDALREAIVSFDDPRVAATTAAMSVHAPDTILRHMQNAEYIFGIILRHALATVNGIHVTPGPFSLYRRSVVDALGGFQFGYQTEDMEMALRLQRAGYRIDSAPRARVYTKAPATLPKLVKQRVRWTSGFLRNVLGEYRGLVGRRQYGALGIIVLPLGFLAIASGLLLTGLAVVRMWDMISTAIAVRSGIPFSYAWVPPVSHFDWFYLPGTFFVGLGVATLIISVGMIIAGKRLSKTPGSLGLGIVSYAFLYGLVAPLWLAQSAFDVTFGKKRGWR